MASKNYEYNKEYAKKWDKENRVKVSVSLSIEQSKKLDTYCKENDIPKSILIKSRLKDIID